MKADVEQRSGQRAVGSSTRSTWWRTSMGAAAALTLAMSGAVVAAGPAAADSGSGTVLPLGGEPLNVRETAGLTSTVVGTVSEGEQLVISCQVVGPEVHNDIDGYTSALWDYVPAEGGFVSDAWIYTGYNSRIPGLPDCGETSPPEPDPGACGTAEFPSGSNAAVVDQLEQRFGFTFVDDDVSWSSAQYRPLLQVWWNTLVKVECTPFLDRANIHNAGGSLKIRAHTHPDDTWGWYRGWEIGLQIDVNKQLASVNNGNPDSVEQNIIHELAHSYNGDRGSLPAYWSAFTALHDAQGGISAYGSDANGGVTENFADVVGFYVARCAGETFYRTPDLPNPFNTNSAATQAYFAFARDQVFDGVTFGPAAGGTVSC